MLSRAIFIRYADLTSVFAAILAVIKFALMRDTAALKALSTIATISFGAFTAYLMFLAPTIGIAEVS